MRTTRKATGQDLCREFDEFVIAHGQRLSERDADVKARLAALEEEAAVLQLLREDLDKLGVAA